MQIGSELPNFGKLRRCHKTRTTSYHTYTSFLHESFSSANPLACAKGVQPAAGVLNLRFKRHAEGQRFGESRRGRRIGPSPSGCGPPSFSSFPRCPPTDCFPRLGPRWLVGDVRRLPIQEQWCRETLPQARRVRMCGSIALVASRESSGRGSA